MAEDEPHAEATTLGGPARRLGHRGTCRADLPRYTAPSGGHRIYLAFLPPNPAAVDDKYAELAALGHGRKEPWDAFWGQRYAVVADPDGNHVDLFAPLQGHPRQAFSNQQG
jgi:catechol 2,3-dioxygenase-like lactoylglutathione lyase family enzyme